MTIRTIEKRRRRQRLKRWRERHVTHICAGGAVIQLRRPRQLSEVLAALTRVIARLEGPE